MSKAKGTPAMSNGEFARMVDEDGKIRYVAPEPREGDDQGETVDGEIVEAEAANLPAVVGPASGRMDLAEMTPEQRAVVDRLNGWMESHQDEGANPEAAIADIIDQVMSAESVDEVLASVQARGLDEFKDQPIRIHAGKFSRSDYEEGLPFYVILDIETLKDGRRHTVTTGAQTVLAQIVRAIQLDGFPLACMLVNASKRPTKRGYWPVKLAPLG